MKPRCRFRSWWSGHGRQWSIWNAKQQREVMSRIMSQGDWGAVQRIGPENARLTRENAELRAIVDKLPTTADGVTKLAGDNVYRCHEGVMENRWVNWSPRSAPWPGYQASYGVFGPPIAVDECYSTREAARNAVGRLG